MSWRRFCHGFALALMLSGAGCDREPTMGVASPERVPNIQFTDITEISGIDFVHDNGAYGEKLLPETMGGGCAFFDFDNDGDQDLVFINSGKWPWRDSEQASDGLVVLYLNDGAGQFERKPVKLEGFLYGMGVACGDFDNDGFVDLFISGVGGNKLLRNEEGRSFVDVTAESGVGGGPDAWSTSSAWLDYDSDGDLDLFVCNYVRWSREIDMEVNYQLPEMGRAYGPPMNFTGAFPFLYRNEGNGMFKEVAKESGLHVTVPSTGLPMGKSLGVSPIDLDQDGWIDLIVANDTVQNFVFHNNRDGTFKEMGAIAGIAYDNYGGTRGAMGIDTTRLNEGRNLAVAIGNFANEMTALYVSRSNPFMFADEAIQQGIGNVTRNLLTFGVFFFDFDLDGRLDLLTANGHIEPEIGKVFPSQSYKQPTQLFWSAPDQGAGKGFLRANSEAVGEDLFQPIVGRGAACADIDGDGDLDVVLTQINAPPLLLRNESENPRFIRLKLVGRQSNRDAIGAWVHLRADNVRMSRHVMPSRGYLSQSELVVTIGLKGVKNVQEIAVEWPGGRRQVVDGFEENALNRVEEE